MVQAVKTIHPLSLVARRESKEDHQEWACPRSYVWTPVLLRFTLDGVDALGQSVKGVRRLGSLDVLVKRGQPAEASE